MKNIKRVLVCIIFFISAFSIPEYSFAMGEETEDVKESYTFLLKKPYQVHEFLSNLKIHDDNFHITVIEEIGLVYIEEYKNKGNLKEILAPYSKKLDEYISAEGELPKLTAPLDEPNISNIKGVEEQNTHLPISHFKSFNWYLEDVTNNFESHTLNKGDNTAIALIDSGIDQEHPLLANNVNTDLGKNYTTSALNINDEMGHGTSVAGVLTQIAPHTTIVPYKVLGAEDGESIWVLEAIIDATNDGNDILNLSLGTYKSRNNNEEKLLIEAYEEAIKYAKNHGALVVTAAGNSSEDLDEANKNDKMYLPGNLKNVITVSSTTNNNTLASYSNYGRNIDFSAPGGDLDADLDVNGLVLTTFPMNKPNNIIDQAMGVPPGYTLSIGTSLSAPQVSATAALIISEYKKRNTKKPKINKVIKYLKEGSSDLGDNGYDVYFGYGKINAYQSLLSIKR